MKRTFVLGDLHGGHKALLQCLERSNFDYEKDTLISLGDISDGWPETVECFEELLKIKNLVMVRGNHDQFLLDYLRTEETPDVWILQGGRATFKNYQENPDKKEAHKIFLMSTPFYYVDKKNRLFVHGGLDTDFPIEQQSPTTLMWDRSLVREDAFVPGYKEVYIGHTSVAGVSDVPVQYGNVFCLDSGGGFEWKLSLMDIDTKEVFQSDKVSTLYPGYIH